MNADNQHKQEIQQLLDILPKNLSRYILKSPALIDLQEIVLDLGAPPEIRQAGLVTRLTDFPPITLENIQDVVAQIGLFNTDNRAGIERTLHRISAIRNRHGVIIGLTCRVGRAIEGTLEIIRDLVDSGKNILFLGPPGIGKTTKLREAARVLSVESEKKVIVVDTSNEIAGDGDIPHPGIGFSRRMQVPSPDKQHAVMIEAVENHTPEVIIVDEIGTEQEAAAARTIAERGVQLIATAHGRTLQNLIKNPTLSDLVGGVQSVILGDEEAKLRGTQKTVLERKSLPTFDCLVEIQEKDIFAVYNNVMASVDDYLKHDTLSPQIRTRTADQIVITESPLPAVREKKETAKEEVAIYPYGIHTPSVSAAIRYLNLSARIAPQLADADLVLTLKSQLRAKSKLNLLLEGKSIPVHIIKANTASYIEKFFKQYFQLSYSQEDSEAEAASEIKTLCKKVLSEKVTADASPRDAFLRRIQHQIVEECGLTSHSVGDEPNRRVRVFP
jgi:stage III sporulation protein AA